MFIGAGILISQNTICHYFRTINGMSFLSRDADDKVTSVEADLDLDNKVSPVNSFSMEWFPF